MATSSLDGANGIFVVPLSDDTTAVCVISKGGGWEHLSVRMEVRWPDGKMTHETPEWDEMCKVKELFWDDPEDVVMQLHPAKSKYVNMHPNVLHLWRPINGHEIPTPPMIMV